MKFLKPEVPVEDGGVTIDVSIVTLAQSNRCAPIII